MNKVRYLKFMLIFVIFFLFYSVKADSYFELSETFNNIVNMYNNNSKDIYNYISEDYKKSIKIGLKKGTITDISNVSYVIDNDTYIVNAYVTANGKVFNSSWNVNSVYMTFRFKRQDNKFILIDSDFLDKSGISDLRNKYISIFKKVGVIVFMLFILMIVSIVKVYRRAMIEENLENNKTNC